ncbi:MAG: hypothetical protein A2139_08515 [Desulfobacca sp. RBG_16_60_12]|nr:MAG: hypothetical protein A2139_08515 [Desulfobacca sp. RBG_16_60_12]
MESYKSQRNEIAGLLRTSTGDLAFLLQEESMDAMMKTLEYAGATPEPAGETAHPAVWRIPYHNATTQKINGSTHWVGQEKT